MALQLLMPKATAVWLVENTALSFEQIAEFCQLHLLEIKAIADGEAIQGIKGLDPIHNGQLSREEIDKGEKDPNYRLKLSEPKIKLPQAKKQEYRYTPLSKRHDRPNAILWLIRNHGELKDTQIARLIGTTKGTIEQIRNRTHWNTANLTPVDPVTLGLCSQSALNREVARAQKQAPLEVSESQEKATLLPSAFTENLSLKDHPLSYKRKKQQNIEQLDIDAIFHDPKNAGAIDYPDDDEEQGPAAKNDS